MKERIHNNDECRWQHPELTGIVLWDKVSQHDRHSTIWANDHAGRNEWLNFDWWLLGFTARFGNSAYKSRQTVWDEEEKDTILLIDGALTLKI